MTAPLPGSPFSPRGGSTELEHGGLFSPRFDEHGLIPAIVTDADGGDVLMFAWMNAETLALTLQTRQAHFWSRSRGKVWKKGEESGNLLAVESVATDCDQDVVLVRARLGGAGVACHTGARSCFYREVADPDSDGRYTLAPLAPRGGRRDE